MKNSSFAFPSNYDLRTIDRFFCMIYLKVRVLRKRSFKFGVCVGLCLYTCLNCCFVVADGRVERI